MTERHIQRLLYRYRCKGRHKFFMPNTYMYMWESDYITIYKDKVYEYEIKVSKGDFKADFKKRDKHTRLRRTFADSSLLGRCPNYFYYAAPKGVISIGDVPRYAGLLLIDGSKIGIVKKAPKIHSKPITCKEYKYLLSKACHRLNK